MWITQGLIASMKGESVNSHRLLHIDNILAHIEKQLLDQIEKETPQLSSRVSDRLNANGDSDVSDDSMQGTSQRASVPVIVPQ
jgi:hypothetical protein